MDLKELDSSYLWMENIGRVCRITNLRVLKVFNIDELKVKVKQSPLQAWSDPEGSRKLRFPDFVTTAQDVGRL